MAIGRGASCAQTDEGRLSTQVAVGGNGDGRKWTASPSVPRLPPFYEPLRADRGRYPGSSQPLPRGPPPLDDSSQGGGPARQPPEWEGGGGAILGTPLLAQWARLVGPPRTRGRTACPRRRVHRTATARTPLPRRGCPHDPGRPPLERIGAASGPYTGDPGGYLSWPARHTRAGPALCLWATGAETSLKKRIVTVRHMAPTLGEPDSPEICPTTTYFKLFRWRPACDHLVAHQPQPQSQYFPGIRNPPERAPT